MSDEPVNPGTGTEKLRYCKVHANPCEKCATCATYSYCPTCEKCYEPNCPDG